MSIFFAFYKFFESRHLILPEYKGMCAYIYLISYLLYIYKNHVQIWEFDHKEGLALKNWCFWTVVLEKTLESPLDRKEIKPVNPKGNQPWIFIGRTDAEAWSSNILATWCKDMTSQKRKERLRAGGEGGNRGWDDWMASPPQRT